MTGFRFDEEGNRQARIWNVVSHLTTIPIFGGVRPCRVWDARNLRGLKTFFLAVVSYVFYHRLKPKRKGSTIILGPSTLSHNTRQHRLEFSQYRMFDATVRASRTWVAA